ncbi:mucin-19 [Bacillus rossius redtenbacheri]|uniref:mucin-19 n=1 Tax=Bacillus rossius redtenbacheri TaxID=93214 RepID=UPI002FDEB987
MADAPSSRSTYKRRGAKPYDISHSLVRRVASSVTQLLPRAAWLSQWLARPEPSPGPPAGPPEISEDEGGSSSSEDEEEEGEEGRKAAPAPGDRPRIPLDRTFPAGSFAVHQLNDTTVKAAGDEHRESEDRDDVPRAGGQEAGGARPPAGGQAGLVDAGRRRGRPGPGPAQLPPPGRDVRLADPGLPVARHPDAGVRAGQPGREGQRAEFRGDDQSFTSESTSVNSSLAAKSFHYKHLTVTPGSKKRRMVGEDDVNEEEQLEDVHQSRGPRSLNLDRKRARLAQSLNCSSASQHEATLGSRNPSFNVDVYPSRKGSESRASLLSSSFYAGETTYGGASAYDRRRNWLQEHSSSACFPRPGAVEVRPREGETAPRAAGAGVSRTARRILDALQQLSTPAREARGVPLPPPARQAAPGEGGPPARPPARPLSVPSVPDLLRLRQRERIRSSVSSARAVAAAARPEEYSLRLEDFQGGSKYVSKVKSKQNSAFEDTAAPLNLPNVPLPITTLPKFDLGFSTASSPVTTLGTSSAKGGAGASIVGGAVQAISPGRAAGASRLPTEPAPTAGQEVPVFTFRRPLDPQDEEEERRALRGLVSALGSSASNAPSESEQSGRGREPSNGPAPGAPSVGGGSERLEGTQTRVGDASERTGGNRPCESCVAGNTASSRVCACGESRDRSPAGFGARFKLSAGLWECQACMVRNKDTDASCVACTAPKPAAEGAKSHDPQTCARPGFGDKFKPAGGTWECSVCLVRNPESSVSCQACTTEKPRSKQDKGQSGGKPAPGPANESKTLDKLWYCTICMACNKPGTKKCSSCDYVNPNSNRSGLQFKFEIPAEASKFKFGVDKAGDKDGTAAAAAGSVCGFNFGGSTKTTAAATTFSFGIPTTTAAKSQLSNADTVVVSSGNAGVAPFSASFKNSENKSTSANNIGTSRKRPNGEDRLDDSTETKSIDGTDGNSSTKKITFCFEPSKGFSSSSDNSPKQIVSSSVAPTPTPSNSPFSSPKNNAISPKTSLAANASFNFSPGSLTGRVAPILKTSASAVPGSLFVPADGATVPSASKSSEVTTPSPSAVTLFSRASPSDSDPPRKRNVSSKQTTDGGSWPGSAVSDVGTAGSNSKLVTAFGSSPVNSSPSASKAITFGTPASSGTPAAPISSAVSVAGSTPAAVSVGSGTAFGTPPAASFALNPSAALFGAPSTTAQAFGSGATTLTPALTGIPPAFSSSTSTTPSVFGLGATKTAATAPAPVFGATSTTASSVFGASTTPAFAATAATTAPMFGTTTNSKATPLFGTTSAPATTTAPPMFGAASAAKAPTFGAAATTATSGFGAASVTASSLFGATDAATTASPVFGTTTNTATLVFGAATTAPSPAFGVAKSVAPPAFGTAVTSAAPSMFASNTSAAAPVFGGSPSTPSFGASAPATSFGGSNFGAGSASAPAFGAALQPGFAAPSTTASAFGSGTTPTQSFGSSAAAQVFGGSASDAKSSEKPAAPFAFGARAAAPQFQFAGGQPGAAGKPDFSFGSANVGSQQRPGFGFGSSAQQQQQQQPFGFGGSPASPAAGSVFGAAQAPAGFGGPNAAAGGFAAGGFSFGQSNTGAFGFPGARPPAPPASAPGPAQPFSFVAAAPMQFDPNAKPTFNFTGGETPVFSANPAAGTPAQPRRIKKAMRRANR